jgi:hypothetical protein
MDLGAHRCRGAQRRDTTRAFAALASVASTSQMTSRVVMVGAMTLMVAVPAAVAAPASVAAQPAPAPPTAPGAPGAGHAQGPLLSGYGGPGSGEQVILGSSLIGRAGGGGGPGSPSAAGGSGESGASAGAGTGSLPAVHSSRFARGSEAGGQAPGPRYRTAGGASARNGAASTRGQLQVHGAPAAAISPVLSTADVLLVVLVACAMAAMGLLTRRLARGAR